MLFARPPQWFCWPRRPRYRSASPQGLAPTAAAAPLRLPTKTRSHRGGSTAVPPARDSLPPWRRRHCCASPQRLAPTLAAVPQYLPPEPRSHLGVGATAAPPHKDSLPPWRQYRSNSLQRLAPTLASAPLLRLTPSALLHNYPEPRSHLGVGATAAPPHKDSLPPRRRHRCASRQRLAPTLVSASPLRLPTKTRSHLGGSTAVPPSSASLPLRRRHRCASRPRRCCTIIQSLAPTAAAAPLRLPPKTRSHASAPPLRLTPPALLHNFA